MSILTIHNLTKQFNNQSGIVVDNFKLNLEKGEIFSLLGESGSGKTTLLRLISGFEVPTSGEIYFNGNKICGNGTFIVPEQRGIGIVFQDYALFPHMNIYKNIAFGLSRLSARERRERVCTLLEIVGLTGFENRYPHELSGGEKQRVAIARALAPEPSLILFDEPFSNLNTLLKQQMREEIKSIIRSTNTTALFVTHDTKDVLAIADRVAVIKNGINLQTGSPQHVYQFPKNEYVANFFGKTNLLKASIIDNQLKTPFGSMNFSGTRSLAPEDVMISVRPESIMITDSGNKDMHIRAKIKSVQFRGEYNEVICIANSLKNELIEISIYVRPDFSFSKDECFFSIQPEQVHVLDAEMPVFT